MSPAEPLTITRRGALAVAGALGAQGLVGCQKVLEIAGLSDELPTAFTPPDGAAIDPFHHLLSRASFGPRPGEVERAQRMGKAAWIDEQLDPKGIDDSRCDLRADAIDVRWMSAATLLELEPAQVEAQVTRHALFRAIHSRRQLFEVTVEHLSDHLHVAIGKGECKNLLPAYDRDVVRAHAFGSFRALLEAAALSPAMLVYLDGRDNKATGAGDRPNENFARELFELHTLGVHGGYTQADVMEAARCLTGFVVGSRFNPGSVELVPERHDDGEKRVLGVTFPAGGGREDVTRLLDLLVAHPSTAQHVSTRLCRAFVSDDPPRSIVDSAAQTFTATKGDLRATLRTVLLSDELEEAVGAKIKRPFRFVASLHRALATRAEVEEATLDWLARMGHAPFAWPTPDGYPVRGGPWLSTLLARAKGAFALVDGGFPDAKVELDRLARAAGGEDGLSRHLLGRRATAEESDALAGRPLAQATALLASSPAFQRF